MNTRIDLKSSEKASYKLATFADCTADLMVGLSLLLLDLFPLTRAALGPTCNALFFLVVLNAIAFVFSWGRKKLGFSRIGVVKFGALVKKRVWISGLITAALSAGMILIWILSSRGQFPNTSAWLGDYSIEIVVSVIVLMILVGGLAYTFGVQRYYLFGILIAACFPLQQLLPVYEGTPFLAAGGIITLCGSVILAGFLKEYPPLDEGQEGN